MKDLGRGVKLVAMGARQSGDIPSRQNGIQSAAGATVRIGDKAVCVLMRGFFKDRFDASWDGVGRIVECGVDALDVQMLPAIGLFERFDFPREGAAGDDQDVVWHRREDQALCARRRAWTRLTAVVAASAASRQ